jgi:hypothetical protein
LRRVSTDTITPVDRGKYPQAAGAIAEAIIKSVELIVQPDAKDAVVK